MSHKILHDQPVEEGIVKTTHDKVTYDEVTQAFIVDIGDRSWCEVYGASRFSKAVEIADLLNGLAQQPQKE